jgi:hypothetical protein
MPTDPQYRQASAYLESIIRDSLRDPESARFGQMIVCSYSPEYKVGIVRVNARNAYGGYAGYATMVAFENAQVRQAMQVRENPYGADQFQEQRAILAVLEACRPVVSAYDTARARR